jgi:hypothetical protein
MIILSKRVNVPQYIKNVKTSTNYAARQVLQTTMPALSELYINTKDSLSELNSNRIKSKSKLDRSVSMYKQKMTSPMARLFSNIKEDLSTGKLYNEDRAMGNERSTIESMIGVSDIDNQSGSGMDMSSFETAINSTSNRGMLNSAASSFATAEYLGDISIRNNIETQTIQAKYHSEYMKAFSNIQNISMSILNFQTKVMADHIKRTHQYYDESITELRSISALLQENVEISRSMYGDSDNSRVSDLERMLTNSGILNVKEYIKGVKNKANNLLPISGGDLKTMTNSIIANPLGTLLMAAPHLLPKTMKKSMGQLDTAVSSLFSSYIMGLNKMKTKGKPFNIIAELLGLDINQNKSVNLGSYVNRKITLELENKKAKSIIEVIPSYLSEITKHLTGIDKVYNYTTGRFEDKKVIRDTLKRDIYNDSTTEMKTMKNSFSYNLSTAQSAMPSIFERVTLERDMNDFIYFLATSGYPFNEGSSTYIDCKKFGLKLRGGEKSFNKLKGMYGMMSKEEKIAVRNEQVTSLRKSNDMINSYNRYIQDTGYSAAINGLDGKSFNPSRLGSYDKNNYKNVNTNTINL